MTEQELIAWGALTDALDGAHRAAKTLRHRLEEVASLARRHDPALAEWACYRMEDMPAVIARLRDEYDKARYRSDEAPA